MRTINSVVRWVLLLFSLSSVIPCASETSKHVISSESLSVTVMMGLMIIDMIVCLAIRKRPKVLLVIEMLLYLWCGITLVGRLISSGAWAALRTSEVVLIGGNNLSWIFIAFYSIIIISIIIVFINAFVSYVSANADLS